MSLHSVSLYFLLCLSACYRLFAIEMGKYFQDHQQRERQTIVSLANRVTREDGNVIGSELTETRKRGLRHISRTRPNNDARIAGGARASCKSNPVECEEYQSVAVSINQHQSVARSSSQHESA